MNTKFYRIKVIYGISVYDFSSESIIASDLIDFLPCIFRNIIDLPEYFFSPKCQISSGNIKTLHKQITSGSGLGQVDDLPDIPFLHVGAGQKETGLR